jgi:hypothetical protein
MPFEVATSSLCKAFEFLRDISGSEFASQPCPQLGFLIRRHCLYVTQQLPRDLFRRHRGSHFSFRGLTHGPARVPSVPPRVEQRKVFWSPRSQLGVVPGKAACLRISIVRPLSQTVLDLAELYVSWLYSSTLRQWLHLREDDYHQGNRIYEWCVRTVSTERMPA